MRIDAVPLGVNPPYDINVIVEVPLGGVPVKYEMDKASGAMFVDRFLHTAMRYPCNYGFIPHTLAEDGDPVDVLVVTPVPLISGAVIQCRPISVLKMTDECGPDAKVLAVPIDRLSTHYRHVETLDELPTELPAAIAHFFEHYKDLEPNKWVRIDGWDGIDAAREEIVSGCRRFQDAPVKPHF